MKTQVTNLKPGQLIDPPQHEKKWLWKDGTKRRMTVKEVREGRVDKNGLWMVVVADCPTPYGDKPAEFKCNMRPDKMVKVHN